MEKKTTHRIIGILVVVALVVVLMPLLFNGSNSEPAQTASVKAPPFPNQDSSAGKPPAALAMQATAQPSTSTVDPQTAATAQDTAGQVTTETQITALNTPQASTTESNSAASTTPTANTISQPQTPPATDPMSASAASSTDATSAAPIPNTLAANDSSATSALPPASTSTSDTPMPSSSTSALASTSSTDSTSSKSENNSSSVVVITPETANSMNGGSTPAAKPDTKTADNQPAVSTQSPATPASLPVADSTTSTATPAAAPMLTAAADNVDTHPVIAPVHKPKSKLKIKHAKATHLVKSNHEMASIKQAVWVVQMGSFHNKNNAHRLADSLRAHGYKAFTREIRSSTRVYVGPEFKQAQATSLAEKIQQDMNMQGIVITFHPLEI